MATKTSGAATSASGARPDWRYWSVAAFATLWNAFTCLDFSLTAARSPFWLSRIPPDVVNWLDSAPTWTLLPWALDVWAGLAGALLLLARSRRAVGAFAASLIGVGVLHGWQWTAGMPASMTTWEALSVPATIWAIAVYLLWFAWTRRAAGVLR